MNAARQAAYQPAAAIGNLVLPRPEQRNGAGKLLLIAGSQNRLRQFALQNQTK